MAVKRVSDGTIAEAADIIRSGGTVIYPTETCYGLGCDATDGDAIANVYDIKERPREKKLTVIVDSLETAEEYCRLTDEERIICETFMPGPLTLVAEKRENVPDLLNTAFAFRIPGSDTARTLAAEAGVPVVATSANITGEDSSYTVDSISSRVREQVDIVLDAGELEETPSSTIVEVVDGEARILREGPVGRDAITAALEP